MGNCAGNVIRKIDKAKLSDCKTECNKDTNCKAVLWVEARADSYCELKSSDCPTLTDQSNAKYTVYFKQGKCEKGPVRLKNASWNFPCLI